MEQAVLTNYYMVKKEKQTASVARKQAKGGVNTLTIVADNEGSDPPNTASLLLTDGITQYSLLAYNPKGQRVVIKIKKVN